MRNNYCFIRNFKTKELRKLTKIIIEKLICKKCKKESDQPIIYSINFSLGNKKNNKNLKNNKQKCPYCGYVSINISK